MHRTVDCRSKSTVSKEREGKARGDIASPAALSLPFVVRIVRTEEHLEKAVKVRAESYGKHHPEVAEQLKQAENSDRAPFSLVLLAESKDTSVPLGTLRIETNARAPLAIEELLPRNSEYSTRTIAFVTRLAVRAGHDASLVKLALFKALHRYCLACQIDWIVVTARPPMDRQYVRLGFIDVYDKNTAIPIPWSAGIPMRIMALETISCERIWLSQNHPLYRFMFVDYCPDIEVFSSVNGTWGRPRATTVGLPTQGQLDEVFGVSVV